MFEKCRYVQTQGCPSHQHSEIQRLSISPQSSNATKNSAMLPACLAHGEKPERQVGRGTFSEASVDEHECRVLSLHNQRAGCLCVPPHCENCLQHQKPLDEMPCSRR